METKDSLIDIIGSHVLDENTELELLNWIERFFGYLGLV